MFVKEISNKRNIIKQLKIAANLQDFRFIL